MMIGGVFGSRKGAADRAVAGRRAGGARPQVQYVQYLRGIAAMLVVFHHVLIDVDWLYNPLTSLTFGAGGVDIFFVISGFVMFVAARGEGALEFWSKRLVRIVPLYWLVTILFFVMRAPHIGEPGLDAASLLRSLLFIPYRSGGPGSPIEPVLIPGWSLNLEMFFYFLFGLGILLSRPVAFSAAAVIAVVATGGLLPPDTAWLAFYSSPIALEFVAGLALGWAWTRGRISPSWWPLAIAGAALLLCSDLFEGYRLVARGAGGAMIMTGAVAAEGAARRIRSTTLTLLGDASYSIYLIHTPLLLVFYAVFKRLPLAGPPQLVVFLVTSLGATAVGGVLLYRWVEQPLTHALRRILPRRQPLDERGERAARSRA